jgi:hypothetical protein
MYQMLNRRRCRITGSRKTLPSTEDVSACHQFEQNQGIIWHISGTMSISSISIEAHLVHQNPADANNYVASHPSPRSEAWRHVFSELTAYFSHLVFFAWFIDITLGRETPPPMLFWSMPFLLNGTLTPRIK